MRREGGKVLEFGVPDLVIFDCDGVLVDSEIIACRILAERVALYVPQIDQAKFAVQSVGKTDESVLAETTARTGVQFPADMSDQVRRAIDAALESELQPVAGAAAMLEALPLPRAVASNSQRARVVASLTKTGLRAHFNEDLFGADMVAHPKPAPDLYLLALERTGTAAEKAVVVEDSVAGLTAARAAGLRVVGFTGASGVPPGQAERLMQGGASVVIDKLADLPGLLADGGIF